MISHILLEELRTKLIFRKLIAEKRVFEYTNESCVLTHKSSLVHLFFLATYPFQCCRVILIIKISSNWELMFESKPMSECQVMIPLQGLWTTYVFFDLLMVEISKSSSSLVSSRSSDSLSLLDTYTKALLAFTLFPSPALL